MDSKEFYQLLFILSVVYLSYCTSMFTYRLIVRLKFNVETKYVMTTAAKVLLWLSIGVFFAYLIN